MSCPLPVTDVVYHSGPVSVSVPVPAPSPCSESHSEKGALPGTAGQC
jgi:hypothetical protein